MNTIAKCLIFVCALVGFACTQFEEEPSTVLSGGVEITITAVREEFEPDMRTVRESDGSVEWCPLDEISVFYTETTNGGSKFTSQNTEQTAIAEFKGKLDGFIAGGEEFTNGKYLYGVYPYSTNTRFKDGVTTISLPSLQTAVEGTFANGLFPTIARAQGVNLAFYNICGGVKFTVSRDDITSVKFKGNNDERLAGAANVVFDEYGKPAVSDEDEAIKSASEITVYAPADGTFEVGKEYYIVAYPVKLSQGFTMTYRTTEMKEGSYVNDSAVEIQRSVFGVVNQKDKNVTFWTDAASTGGGDSSGIYLGIMGFNWQLYPYSIGKLTQTSKSGFDSFIDDLNMEEGTRLYTAINQTINTLQSVPLPANLSTAAIITFTDGLDKGSTYDSEYETDEEYLDALNHRIMNETVNRQPITAYSIGIRGTDVKDVTMFQNNLIKLASSADNATEVTSMGEVNARFKEIAEQLSQSSYVQTLNLAIPGEQNGRLIRFTFDGVKDAEKSSLYIEGTFNRKNNSLENVVYKGLSSTSGTTVKITGLNEKGFLCFTFENIHTDNNKLLIKGFINEWYITSNNMWQINSEFKNKEDADIKTSHSSAVIMLVLDCSSSLAGDFVKAQTNAKDFINTLYEAVGGDSGFGENPGDNDNKIYSTTPKDLSLAISKDGTRYYLTKEDYDKANLSDAVIEGLCVVSSIEAPFIIALKNVSSDKISRNTAYYMYKYELPTANQGWEISARWTDINNALRSFGGDALITAWTCDTNSDGQYYYIGGAGGVLHWYSDNTILYTEYVRKVVSINNLPIPWVATPINDLTLAVTNGNTRLFIDKIEYATKGVPSGYTIEGLAICAGRYGNFIIELKDKSSDAIAPGTAVSLYGSKGLPSIYQGLAISAKWTDVNNALKAFGGDAITDAWLNGKTDDGYYYFVNKSGGVYSWNYNNEKRHVRIVRIF